MKKIAKTLVAAGALALGATSFAGGVAPAPVLSGFYMGLGAAYNVVDYRHKQLATGPNQTVTEDRLAPMVQLGWISAPVSHVAGMATSWGVKAFYKYLAFHSNALVDSSRAEHEVAAMLTWNLQLTSSAYMYLGAGLVVFPSVKDTVVTLPTVSHTLYGGIGQVGALYHFSPNWFFDAAYSYASSSSKSFNQTGANRHVQVVNQELTMTMNYLINM